MIVRALELEGFRNYADLKAEFSPGVNVIYGENAQGKTNLLEAVGYLSSARSHRARWDRELIAFDRDRAEIRALVESREREFRVEALLQRGRRRRLTSNGVRLRSAVELSELLHTVLFCPEDLALIRAGSAERRRFLDISLCQLRPRYAAALAEELSELLHTVLFCPEDLALIRAGSAERRRFLDISLCQLRPRYAAALAEYHRLQEHKTRILRDWEEKPSLLDLLPEFNDRMARCGAVLIHYRAHFIRKLSQRAGPIHGEFAGGRERLELVYETVSTVSDPFIPTREIYPLLLRHQETHRRAELESRQCLSGPHKDDLAVSIDGRSAKQFASQGQTRTAVLSLKLAEREIHQEDLGEWPVLLLDDVLSELDQRRRDFVLRRIRGGQVFITCCEEDGLEGLEGRTFRIRGGTLAEGN